MSASSGAAIDEPGDRCCNVEHPLRAARVLRPSQMEQAHEPRRRDVLDRHASERVLAEARQARNAHLRTRLEQPVERLSERSLVRKYDNVGLLSRHDVLELVHADQTDGGRVRRRRAPNRTHRFRIRHVDNAAAPRRAARPARRNRRREHASWRRASWSTIPSHTDAVAKTPSAAAASQGHAMFSPTDDPLSSRHDRQADCDSESLGDESPEQEHVWRRGGLQRHEPDRRSERDCDDRAVGQRMSAPVHDRQRKPHESGSADLRDDPGLRRRQARESGWTSGSATSAGASATSVSTPSFMTPSRTSAHLRRDVRQRRSSLCEYSRSRRGRLRVR